MWGIWDKNNREFCGHYEVNWDVNEDVYPLGRRGSHTYMFKTPIEAEQELQSWSVTNHYEIMELPADEPEWVYY